VKGVKMDAIVERILNGDHDAFELIMDKHFKEIFVYVVNQVHNSETANDITQDIFIKVYNNLKKYNAKKASLRTYIYTVARTTCLDYFKSKAYKQSLEMADYDIELVGSGHDAEAEYAGRQIDDVVKKRSLK
jgi:RNA polymerase sigma-70 factor (ECF subfamily)